MNFPEFLAAGHPFPMADLEAFEKRAIEAKRNGFTHMDIGQLYDRSRWQVADDPTDPWLQWNLANPSFFKILPPEPLKNFVPAEEAKKNLDLVIARGKILEKHGLKGMFTTWDPTWVPECFFDGHPEWRGPRVDHPRRTKNKRFSPCMDHPDILKMFRDTVRQLLTLVPSISNILLYTNDSGTGMCWSSMLYNSPNGPAACRHIGTGQRIATFLETLRLGALDAGVDATVTLTSQLSQDERMSALAALKPGTGLLSWERGELGDRDFYRAVSTNMTYIMPTRALPMHALYADNLRTAFGANRVLANITPLDESYFADYAEMTYIALSGANYELLERNALLLTMAKKYVPVNLAGKLMDGWEKISSGMAMLAYPGPGLTVLDLCLLMQRWVTRPFVPFPLELTDDEKSYYINYLFSANGEEEQADMLIAQGYPIIDSVSGAHFMRRLWTGAIGKLDSARAIFDELAEQCASESLRRTAYSLRAMVCLARCGINCALFQSMMYELEGVDGTLVEKPRTWENPDRADVYGVYRNEIDNMYDLLDVLKVYPDIVVTGERPDQEDCFTFSPEIAKQIQKKIDIMMNHWQDFDRLFARPNR